jgi:hypothetical protein
MTDEPRTPRAAVDAIRVQAPSERNRKLAAFLDVANRERELNPAVTCVAGVEPPRGTNGVPSATSKSGEQSAPGDGGDDGDARRPILRARARFESGFRHRGRPYFPHTPLQVPSMPKTPARNRRRSRGRCCLLAGRTTAPISRFCLRLLAALSTALRGAAAYRLCACSRRFGVSMAGDAGVLLRRARVGDRRHRGAAFRSRGAETMRGWRYRRGEGAPESWRRCFAEEEQLPPALLVVGA